MLNSDTSLYHLHCIIQVAFDWENSHLHQFRSLERSGPTLQPPYEWLDEDGYAEDYTSYTVADILSSPKDKFIYEYDFGDSWEHIIVLEKILDNDSKIKLPVCIKGKLATPPEDCGGIWGFYAAMEALTDKSHPEHEDALEWYGEDFAPTPFDMDEINQVLQNTKFEEFEM